MLKAVWKMVSLFLALAGFLTVGVVSLLANEELIWVVGKAFVAFLGCWIVLKNLGAMLFYLLEKQDAPSGAEVAASENKRG